MSQTAAAVIDLCEYRQRRQLRASGQRRPHAQPPYAGPIWVMWVAIPVWIWP